MGTRLPALVVALIVASASLLAPSAVAAEVTSTIEPVPSTSVPTSEPTTTTTTTGTEPAPDETTTPTESTTTTTDSPATSESTAAESTPTSDSTTASDTSTTTTLPPADPCAPPVEAADGSTTTVGTSPSSTTTTIATTTPAEGADGQPTSSVADPCAPADPLVGEEPGEEAPETDETVPPDGAYGGQSDFRPAEVLWSSVRAAEQKVAAATDEFEQAVDAVRALRRDRKELELQRAELSVEAQSAAAEVVELEAVLTDRAVAAFMGDGSLGAAAFGGVLDAEGDVQALELQSRGRLLDAALGQDREAISDYLELRSRIDADTLDIVDSIRLAERAIRAGEQVAEEALDAVTQAESEAEAFRAGSSVYIDDVVFPVAPGYQTPLIDSWGFPRMPGTPDEHWHEGIDIFAPAGTPLVAAERSVVTTVGTSRLGGLKVWLRGESGADWYYAHLQSHAPDLVEGMVIDPGHVIGYVGNTGNAVGTPPHLHLQLHPDGGAPVNPFPLLNVIATRDAQ